MSQGSQVPIPEEANALQSFMQNNVTWKCSNKRFGVDGADELANS